MPEGHSTVLMPSLDFAVNFGEHSSLIASLGGSWREPSFTELHYQSPSNHGNPDLVSEDALGGELGFRHSIDRLRSSLTLFERHTWNRIDWVREDASSPWNASNIGSTRTRGLESSFSYTPSIAWLNDLYLSATWLDADHTLEHMESKYALNFLTHQVKAGIQIPFFFGSLLSVDSRHERRRGKEKSDWLADLRFSHHFDRGVDLFVDVRNLGNINYADQVGVPMPGRWLSAGCRLALGGEASR